MLLRFLKAFTFLLIGSINLPAQEVTLHYQHDTDYIGITDVSDYSALHDLANSIADTLKNIYAGSFQVVDGGQYYLSNHFEENPTDHFDRRFEEVKQGKDALLYIGRVINLSGEFNYYSRVHLIENDAFSCLGEAAATSMQSYLNATMNEHGATSFVNGQLKGLELFLEKINYLTLCCVQNENKHSENVCSACDMNGSITSSPFDEFENIILGHGDKVKLGKFTPLRNTIFQFPQSGPQFRDVQISQSESNNTRVPNIIGTLVSHPTAGTFNLFDDILAVKEQVDSLGQRDRFHVSVLYIDETNCSNLNSFLSTDQRVNSYQSSNGTGNSCNTSDPLRCNGGECMLYEEQLIILNFNGEIRVYSKISSPWPADYTLNQNLSEETLESGSVIFPALIVREVLKRVAMGAINVFIDAGITIAIEKTFGTPTSCQSGEDTWYDAWSRYRIAEFSNTKYAVWKFILTFAEGAIGGPVFDALIGGVQNALKYLITGSNNFTIGESSYDSISINGPPGFSGLKSSNFSLKIFFQKFAVGVATASAGEVIGWTTSAAKKLSKKQVGAIIDEIVQEAGREIPDELASNVLAKVLLDLKADGAKLFWEFVKNPKLVRAWEVMYSGNVDVALRRDPSFLTRFLAETVPTDRLIHANRGNFTYINGDPTQGVSRMKGGGHGQENLDYLNSIGFDYNIVVTHPNGVRLGNVPIHKTVGKRTGTRQAWFPSSWTANDIEAAGKIVVSITGNASATDGAFIFGYYKGVRVGVQKTNGQVGSVFPDWNTQN